MGGKKSEEIQNKDKTSNSVAQSNHNYHTRRFI